VGHPYAPHAGSPWRRGGAGAGGGAAGGRAGPRCWAARCRCLQTHGGSPARPVAPRPPPRPAPAVCAPGYCGSLQTDDPTEWGCAPASAGTYGFGLGLRAGCLSCTTTDFRSYADKPGAAKCAACAGSLAANPAGTGCGNLVTTKSSLMIDPGSCTPATIASVKDAYTAFLKSRPGVVPESVVVDVTCTQLVGARRGVARRGARAGACDGPCVPLRHALPHLPLWPGPAPDAADALTARPRRPVRRTPPRSPASACSSAPQARSSPSRRAGRGPRTPAPTR
jgi:hypothetical protein